MKRARLALLLSILLLPACLPGGPFELATETAATPMPALMPFPTATGLPPPGAPQVAVLSPPLVDGDGGRLYTAGQVNGQPRLAVLDTRDGRLLAAWDVTGQPALDAARNRLAVDRGATGLGLLDATTGESQGQVQLPPAAGESQAAPQIDPRTGLIYAFRGATVFVIDPASRSVLRSTPLSVDRLVCDTPGGVATINEAALDPVTGRLFLSFITHTCIPWVTVTVVALAPGDLTETGRIEIDVRSQFAAHDGMLHGVTVSRLGPTLYWTWDGVEERLETPSDYLGELAGIVVDGERGLVYEAIGRTVRIVEARRGEEIGRVEMPVAGDARLAGHDPVTDTLYFTSPAGRLTLWPAAGLFEPTDEPPAAAPSPLPDAPVTALALSPNWAGGGALLALVEDGDCPAGSRLFVMLDPTVGWQPGIISPNGCDTVAAAAFSTNYARDSLIFAATHTPPTVWYSVDGGRSWTAAGFSFPSGTTFRDLLVSPAYADDQTLFALAEDGRLYRSRDGGRGWQALEQRLDRIAAVEEAEPLALVGAAGDRLMRSANGETWEELGPTPDGESVALLVAARSAGPAPALYVFTSGGRLARSIDEGASWSVVMETSPGAAQLVAAGTMPPQERAVFLLREGEIIASHDGLASIWAATSATEAGRYRPSSIALPPDFTAAPFVFVGTVDGQVLRVDGRPSP